MSERTNGSPWLNADPFLTEHVAQQLGPDGTGVVRFGPVIEGDHASDLYDEISQFDGNLDDLNKLPLTSELVQSVRNLVSFSVAEDFPALADWNPDTITLGHGAAGYANILLGQENPQPWSVNAVITISDRINGASPDTQIKTGRLTLVRSGILPN